MAATRNAFGRATSPAPDAGWCTVMRWHRWCAAIGAVLMAYIAVTGLGIQLADMRALLSNAPATDPDMRMMRQHVYGPPNYAVLSPPDFTGRALPSTMSYGRGLARAASLGREAVPGGALRLVELRMIGERPAAHVQMGDRHLIFDLATGSPLPAGDAPPQEPGREARSPRATFKFLHRFNYLGQAATGLNGLAGIAFAIMITTGLVQYRRVLRMRLARGRDAPFWRGGGGVRDLHRWFAVAASLPIMWITASGFLLSVDNVGAFIHSLGSSGIHDERAFEGDQSAPLDDREIAGMARVTMGAFHDAHPDVVAKVVRLRWFARYPQGVVVADDRGETKQYVYDARTGSPMSMSENGYPDLGFPSGWEWHQRLKRIHRGDIFGMTGRWLDTLGGVALVYLTFPGIWIYYQLWRRRSRSGRSSPFW